MSYIAAEEGPDFLPITWYQSVTPDHYTRYQYLGIAYLPTLVIDDYQMIGSYDIRDEIEQEIADSLALGSPVEITVTVSGSGVSGTVKNISGGGLSNLRVFCWGYEPGQQNDHAINTVRQQIGDDTISSLSSGQTANYNFSETVGPWRVVVAVFDSSKRCLNCLWVE